MKKSELDTLRSFVRHVELLMPLLPRCVDSSRHPPKVVNARRVLDKEISRVKKIIKNLNDETKNI